MKTENKSPIRILHILGSVQCGGVETVIFNNYRAIDRDKVQFDIAIDNCSPCKIPSDIIALGAKIYEIPPYTKLPSYIHSISKICKENNYQIVHSHMNAMSVFPLFAAWMNKVPVRIAHSHSTSGGGKDLKRDLFKFLLRPLSRVFSTHYFACSKHAACWLFGQKTMEENKITILKNGISTETFKFQPQVRNELRQKLGINEKFVVGHVGRFSPPKNHLFLIQVFADLCKLRDDCVLLLIGGIGSAGAEIENKLRKAIHELGVADKVLFLGTRNDVYNYYQAMDVFILPSLYEGLGLACIEAQCSGLPCILSDRVPKEAQVNRNVWFLPLEKQAVEWTTVVLENQGERHDCSNHMIQAGYEIKYVAKELEEFYLKHVF